MVARWQANAVAWILAGDADYRGEVRVILQNLGREPFVVQRGMRVAQLVLQQVPRVQWEEAAELTATERGGGGFGHTGRG